MKRNHVSVIMMTVSLAYSAPVEYEYVEILTPPSTPTPQIRRQNNETPGRCCSSVSQRCCPYDFDDRCKTLCGYNNNQRNKDINENGFTKYGLPCRINDDRVECGYGHYVNDNYIPNPNDNSDCCKCCDREEAPTTTANPTEDCCHCCDNDKTTTTEKPTYSDCCHCCENEKVTSTTEKTTNLDCCHCCDTEKATSTTTLETPTNSDCCHCCDKTSTEAATTRETITTAAATTTETTTTTTETTTTTQTTTTTERITTTEPMTTTEMATTTTTTEAIDPTTKPIVKTTETPGKLVLDKRITTPRKRKTTCVTVKEMCEITYDSPCIMETPCGGDYEVF